MKTLKKFTKVLTKRFKTSEPKGAEVREEIYPKRFLSEIGLTVSIPSLAYLSGLTIEEVLDQLLTGESIDVVFPQYIVQDTANSFIVEIPPIRLPETISPRTLN